MHFSHPSSIAIVYLITPKERNMSIIYENASKNAKKDMHEVGFEPTPALHGVELKSNALDQLGHSCIVKLRKIKYSKLV